MMKHVLALSLLSISLPLSLHAQEWTRFRGTGGNGVNQQATLVPASFTEKDYRWSQELPGAGTSSPVLWGTKLFLTAEGAAEGSRSVLCYDSVEGKLLWNHSDTFKPHGHHRFNNFASSTPAVDSTQVYVAWTNGDDMHVVALTHDGKKVWQQNLGFFKEEHGSGASPVVVGNVVVIAKDHSENDAFLTGLSTKDGSTLWKLPRTTLRSSFSTPLVIEDKPGHPVVVFSSNPNALTCVDPATGKEVWRQDFPQKTKFRSVGSPAFAEGIYFSTVGEGMGGRDGAAIRITNGKPEIAWEMPKAIPYVPTPLGLGGHFYMLNDSGILTCLKASSGEVVYSERVAENAYSSPICAADRIICISRKGDVVVVKAGPKFEVLGRSTLGEACESTPALANGMMFIRTAKKLIALGGTKPEAKNIFHGKGVDVEMVSETTSIQPGKPFTVGFSLKHAPRFHTYWKNPGLAGVPFKAEWTLPEGWTAGEMMYAAPDKVYMADILTHGYERDVIHLVEITPPVSSTLTSVDLKVKASWMCCATTCHPTFCNIELSLPVKAEAPAVDPIWQREFNLVRASQPASTDAWKFSAVREGSTVTLIGEPAQDTVGTPQGSEPIFFSDDNLICSHPPQRWTWDGAKFTTKLTVSEFPPKDTSTLRGLLYSKAGWEKNASKPYISIAVPLVHHQAKTAGN